MYVYYIALCEDNLRVKFSLRIAHYTIKKQLKEEFIMPAHFFTAVPPIIKQKNLINVGGNGDCGFRSIAAGIIDNYLSHKKRNSELFSSLLSQYYEMFPEDKALSRALTLEEKLQVLTNTPIHKHEFLVKFAFLLRQCAVDELERHPGKYPGAFIQNHEKTAPQIMREQYTWVDESALAALAKSLNLPLVVSYLTAKENIPVKFNYGPKAAAVQTEIHIQLCNQHYCPKVTHTDWFSLSITKTVMNEPQLNPVAKEGPSLKQILDQIAQMDKKILSEFEHHKTLLTQMLNDGSLAKSALIDLYIKSMDKSDYLQKRLSYAGLEHGNQDFFMAMLQRNQIESPVNNHDKTYGTLLTTEIIHALARAMSVDEIKSELVYEEIDNLQRRHRIPVEDTAARILKA